MDARVTTKAKNIDGKNYQFKKFTALEGFKIAKLIIAKIIPLAQTLISDGSTDVQKELKDIMKNTNTNILEKVEMDTVVKVINGISEEDLETIARVTLSKVSLMLPGQLCQVVDSNGFYQAEEVEYDPALFVALIWEELKFGLEDFFKGDRWSSLLADSLAILDSPLPNA